MIVFVHGVPETEAVWSGIRQRVGRPSVAVSLPGFGNPRPAGFRATKEAYVLWLLDELDAIDEPIDLVGHDWGSILVGRVANAHGDRLRSYAFDCGNLLHPTYEWHAIAQIWQTPEEGEAFFAAQEATSVDDRAAGLQALGVPEEGALEMAEAASAEMGTCILDLYRSAVPNPHHDWGPLQRSSARGLVIHAARDPFSDGARAREVADAMGAGLDGVDAGHFWPYESPDAGAAVLERFWASLD